MEAYLYKKSNICFRSDSKRAILKFPLQSTRQSSFSFVLELANFLTTIKNFIPPNFTLKSSQNTITSQNQTQKKSKYLQNYYQLWCDYIFTLVTDQKITTIRDQIIVISEIQQQSFSILQKSNKFNILSQQSNQSISQTLKDFTEAMRNTQQSKIPQNEMRKIGIINFSSSVLNKDKMQPKIQIEGLLAGILYNPGDQWKSFRILKNDIPKGKDLADYNTIILTGSSYSVSDMSPLMKQFRAILIQTLKVNKKIKVVGICFGHQFLAHMEGINITSKPLNKGVTTVHFDINNLLDIPYLSELAQSETKNLRVYKYHGDHVNKVPDNYNMFAKSAKCQRQAFLSKDKRVISFQFHPQYTQQYIQAYEKRVNSMKSEPSSKQIDKIHHKSVQIVRKIMRNFINWNSFQ